ncbi:MAG: cyclic nucleotide-binding domain-containing protein, partial [Rhodocyclaceae bacterium]|nr:cyclic nucleotide-binding domain-containing protein [Rhodocyclaceae bacterium]
TERLVPRGAIILNAADAGESLFAITAGRVKVFIGDEDGREITVKMLGPGDFFGEMSLIDQEPRSASVSAVEATTLKILSYQAFRDCLIRFPGIGIAVMTELAKRLRDADRKIFNLALMDVYGRVASILLELATSSDGRLVVGERLSQQEIANMVGASREMVNRILKDLSDRGYISVEAKQITIHNNRLPPGF